jgi:hypothetical protein
MRNKERRRKKGQEGYEANRQRVFDIYGKERGKDWDCHHVRYKSEGGGNEKSNLFPIFKTLHRLLHQGATREEIHQCIIDTYGRDPYQ